VTLAADSICQPCVCSDTYTQRIKTVCFYGVRNGNARLTARQVRLIRKLYATGDETCRSLAEKFNVGRQTVYNIVERVIWLRSRWRTDEFWLVSGASLAMMCILAMTRAVNIPINKRVMTWNAAAPPSDLSTVWAPWERIHSIRTVLAIVAFTAEVIALSIRRLS
jgi:hypothetical protein